MIVFYYDFSIALQYHFLSSINDMHVLKPDAA